MIQISKSASAFKARLDELVSESSIDAYKIFVRINYVLDIYVFTKDNNNFEDKELDDLSIGVNVYFYYVTKEDSEDPFNAVLKEGELNCIDWESRFRFSSLLQKRNIKPTKHKTPIITFYSYKGGMGRTTTMVSYAMDLAINKRKRVAIIDCDLEAPGYINFFNLSKHSGLNSGKVNGLVEFFSDMNFVEDSSQLDINNYMINVGLGNEDSIAYKNLDNIWLVPAGNLNAQLEENNINDRTAYLEGLSRINLSNIRQITNGFKLLFNKIEATVRPDFILLDSRTGFNDIFGTAAFYLSDFVVAFFGFNQQTQPGIANLIREYYNPNNTFKLHIVYSILPPKENNKKEPDWVESERKMIEDYINYIGNETKDTPRYTYLHRDENLVAIGSGEIYDAKYVDTIRSKKNKDYYHLFKCINENYITKTKPNNTPIQLRNVVLKHLKDTLSGIHLFAEQTDISENKFFYRDCMKELFDKQKFIIRGYKGTGKTYIYRALSDKAISANIQKWAGRDETDIKESIFVNILPVETGNTETIFDNIQYSSITEPEYYFKCLWQIYTWNTLLLYDEFKTIKKDSDLLEYILPTNDAAGTLKRYEDLIRKGIDTLIVIENDLKKVNNYLNINNIQLFILYDRLDTCINPLFWNKAVSPLFNYWRNNHNVFSNIMPKIFVRTDLYRLVLGTNTVQLEEKNIISIEWSIGEVFGYFFKLIFSNKEVSETCWQIATELDLGKDYINFTKNSFEKDPKNQFKSFGKSEMALIVQMFFGKDVIVKGAYLGNPWEYFQKELSTADNNSVTLRPFINLLNKNAVDKALARTEKSVQSIISSEIYASQEVRDRAANDTFEDLARDRYSQDLLLVRELIRSAKGEEYKYKALTEEQFEHFVEDILSMITDSPVVKSTRDIKDLLFANGIMAEKVTNRGRFYRFASIYWYSWGLKNSELENEDRNRYKKLKPLQEDVEYKGQVIEPSFGLKKRIQTDAYYQSLIIKNKSENSNVEIGDKVMFYVGKEPNKKQNTKDFYFAYNIRKING